MDYEKKLNQERKKERKKKKKKLQVRCIYNSNLFLRQLLNNINKTINYLSDLSS